MSRGSGDDVLFRWPAARPFVLIGTGCVIAGGLVAAVTRPLGFGDGPWVAAYLVLVAGVAQVGLGAGRVLLASRPPTARHRNLTLACWNLANIAVLAGTLAGLTALVIAGGAILFVALALFLRGTGDARPESGAWLLSYRLLVGLLAVSIPVGLLLSVLRNG